MFKHIKEINFKIVSLFVNNYSATYSIREITKLLRINYSNAFKRVKELSKDGVLKEQKIGKAHSISLDIFNLNALHLLGFVEQQQSLNIKNTVLFDVVKGIVALDPFACIGLFGSRVSGKARKESDWDVFAITTRQGEVEKVLKKFPYATNIQLQAFSLSEFMDNLVSAEETVVKHIVKNKKILYNPYPFYNLIQEWEMIRHAPTQ